MAAAPPPAETAAAVAEERPTSAAAPAVPAPAGRPAEGQPEAPGAAEAAAEPRAGGIWGLRLDAELVGKLCLLTVAMLWGSYNPMQVGEQGKGPWRSLALQRQACTCCRAGSAPMRPC